MQFCTSTLVCIHSFYRIKMLNLRPRSTGDRPHSFILWPLNNDDHMVAGVCTADMI